MGPVPAVVLAVTVRVVSPAGSVVVLQRSALTLEAVVASCATVKLRAPGVAVGPAVTVTPVEVLVPFALLHASGLATVSAADVRACSTEFTVRYALAVSWVADSFDLSAVCGAASTCR